MTQLKPYLPANVSARIWRRRDRRRFEPAPSRHAELVVFIGINGNIEYYIEGRIMMIEPRTVLLAYPGEAHFLLSETSGADMVVGVVAPRLVRHGKAHPSLALESETQRPFLARLSPSQFEHMLALSDELERSLDPDVVELGMGWWLHKVWHAVADAGKDHHAQLPAAVGKAIELINEDPSISIAAVARMVGLTHTRLGQIFREAVGITPSEFRLQRRLDLFAEIMEREPGSNLLKASIGAGFGDYSTFYRAYLKYHGHAPDKRRAETAAGS